MRTLFALRNLVRNPRRTAALVLTVAVGTSSLYILQAFNLGMLNQYRDRMIHSKHGNGEVTQTGYRDQVYEKPWDHWITNWTELKPKLAALPGVTHLFPRLGFFSLLTNGKITIGGKGQGIDAIEESKFFDKLNIVEGTNLTDQPDGVILGQGIAHSLGVHVGDRVTVLANTVFGSANATDLVVTGIFYTGSKDFDDYFFRLQLKEAMSLLDTDRIESVNIGLSSIDSWDGFKRAVDDHMPGLSAVSFSVLDKVYYQNGVDFMNAIFRVVEIILVFVVMLGILNIISTELLERKQEIGTLRANGEAVGDVMGLFVTEGIAMGIISSIVGVLIALSINTLFLHSGIPMPPPPGHSFQPPVILEMAPSLAFYSFLLSSVSTIAGTLLASMKISRIPISDALRAT